MSDMEQSDITAAPADAAPAEPTAEPTVAAPAEVTAEELQAEIVALQAEVEAQNSAAVQTPDAPADAPAPDPVPVIARTPSSDNPTQQPEAAPSAPEPLSLADAARVLLIYVKAHRTAGDSDLEAAVADVEAALANA